jgi:ribbon-helix-helix CopG family protein
MRTTIRMNDELLGACKAAAAASGQTMTAFIEEAVRRQLSARVAAARETPPQIPVFAGTGTRPGIDLDDSAALRDTMERT